MRISNAALAGLAVITAISIRAHYFFPAHSSWPTSKTLTNGRLQKLHRYSDRMRILTRREPSAVTLG
jgi:hypothetical protein